MREKTKEVVAFDPKQIHIINEQTSKLMKTKLLGLLNKQSALSSGTIVKIFLTTKEHNYKRTKEILFGRLSQRG